MKKNHKAAVKAIAWSDKNYNTIATGAGSADKFIWIWDVSKKKLVYAWDTGS